MPDCEQRPEVVSTTRLVVAQAVTYLLALAVVIPVEIRFWSGQIVNDGDPLSWPESIYWYTPFLLPLMVLAPIAFFIRRGLLERRARISPGPVKAQGGWWDQPQRQRGFAGLRPWILSAVVAAVSITSAAHVGEEFSNLPPAYHDEYSYLFQAKTFLAGRVSYPSHETPRLFDQVHVLNEGRFASRYFPGTGIWIAPFLAWGHPYWGHWLAGGLTAVLVFWTGRELGGDAVGFIAGLVIALSPGMALFGNLLLAHHPTLAGLSLFLFAFMRMSMRQQFGYAVLAGIGLTFAMLCRPMTAAGVGFPFGLVFAWWIFKGNSVQLRPVGKQRGLMAAGLGVPILTGLVALFFYNQAITGNGFTTTYQLYTDVYTPRHVYGFNNVIRGEQKLGPRVLENYDRWAENLTPALAAKNGTQRLIASTHWTLGIVPLSMVIVMIPFTIGRTDRGWWLIIAAIVSLHAAHIPYWYHGIMFWHYVFESGPLWALLFAFVTAKLVEYWRITNRPWMPTWWLTVTVITVLAAYASFDPFWKSQVDREIPSLRFSRLKYAQFHSLIRNQIHRPTIVLVESDPADRHIDYVVNDPDLSADVIYARYLPEIYSIDEIKRLFPDRNIALYRASSGELIPIP